MPSDFTQQIRKREVEKLDSQDGYNGDDIEASSNLQHSIDAIKCKYDSHQINNKFCVFRGENNLQTEIVREALLQKVVALYAGVVCKAVPVPAVEDQELQAREF